MPARAVGSRDAGAPYRRRRVRPDPVAPTRRSAVLAEHPEPDAPEPATGVAASRRPRTVLLLGLAAVVLALDVASKVLVVATMTEGQNIRLLGGLVYLSFYRNPGAAFSFAEGATVLFSLLAIAVAVVIVRTARRLFSTGWAVALGLVLGGALGNLVDRLFRGDGLLRGAVVDFISVFGPDGRVWPIFNVADSAIVCGGILGAVLALRGIEFDGSRARGKHPAGTGDGDPGTGDGTARG
jgi:signal peptidase II